MRTLIRCTLAVYVLAIGARDSAAQTSGTIAGHITAERDGAPVAGAVVSLAGASTESKSDTDGRFTLTAVAAGEHTVVITRDGFAPLSQPVTVTPGQTVRLDVRLPAALTLSEELTVSGRLSDYVEATALASKTSARLVDVPQAIAVLPARLLDDIGALDTKDLYRHISGVRDSPYSSTVVRGFTQREVLVNGVRGNPYGSLDGDVSISGFSTSQFRLTNIERVEILKGPASVLYGSGEPGGVINYVTKKPKERFNVRAVAGTGQYRQALGEAEVTGPANAARTVLYRGAIYFEDRDDFRFNSEQRNTHLSGGLTWKATSRSAVNLEYEFIDQHLPGHRLRGIPVNAAGQFLTAYEWTSTEPGDFTSLRAHVMQARYDHALARGARIDSTFRFLTYDRSENYHEPRGITADGRFMQREFRDQFRTNDDWSWAITLSTPVSVGASRHDIAYGADVTEQDHLFRFATAAQRSRGGPVENLSLANPVYGLANPATYGITAASLSTDTALSRRTGLYAQDLVALGAKWDVLLGGRVDWYDDTGRNGAIALSDEQHAATGRAGIVFKPTHVSSLYASYATGFVRPSILAQTPSANGPHEPETADQLEVGTKGELAGGRVQTTASVFRAVKRQALRPDPNLGPGGNNVNALLATGEVHNTGFEFDLAGQLTTRWNLAFNYAYLHSRITKDASASAVGKPMPNAAPHSLGLFTRVDVTSRDAVAMSLAYVAERQEPFAGIRAPEYTVIDAHYYHTLTDRIRVRVKCENVFDRRYATSSLFAARAGNFPGQPRTVSATMTISSR